LLIGQIGRTVEGDISQGTFTPDTGEAAGEDFSDDAAAMRFLR
jgi:hypothetical protein